MSQPDFIFSDLPNSLFPQTQQVCVVTRDLDACIRGFADRLGIGPWWVNRYEAPLLANAKLRGAAVECRFLLALAWTGSLNWEVIQPLDGPSIYKEYLEAQGEGIHHVGFFLQTMGMDWEVCHRELEQRGFARLFEAQWSGVSFCYYDTLDPTHTTFEIIHRPAGWTRPEPNYWYPAKPA